MIIFYSMNGCGFCSKAKEELSELIDSGVVVVKDASEAKGESQGFPYFKNSANGKTHTGYAPLEKLLAALEFEMENFTADHRDWCGI